MGNLKNYFKEWNTFEKTWLIVFTLINIYLFYVWQDTLIGLIASLTGMACVVLTAKGRITQYYLDLYFEGNKSPLVEEIIKLQDYDLAIFLEPDIKWVDDGLRFTGEKKQE